MPSIVDPSGDRQTPDATTYGAAQAWEDNYRSMAARWATCDAERLELKEQLADAEMRLRALTIHAPAGGNARLADTPHPCAPGEFEREVPATPPAGRSTEGAS